MSQVVFVQTRTMLQPNMYDGYRDFFRLAELSGYQTCYINEVDPASDNTYIVTPLNGEWNHGWKGDVRADIVLWDLEWRLKESDYAWSESDLTIPPGVARVWASDKWYAERINAEYVPLGSHPGLVGTATTDQSFDVAPLAYRTGRRNAAFGQMERNGLTLAPNCWGEARDAALKASRAVVHVHQHDNVPTVAPLRFAIAAAWHKPLISEQVHERGIFEDAVLYAEYSVLADYTAIMVRRYPQLLRGKADELHDMLCLEHSFRKCVEKAL
jgi:hypothetical protein